MTRVGIVLLAHGSRGQNANDGMYEVAQALRKTGSYGIVEIGFMQRNFPTIEEAAQSCVLQGADTVLLIPYFLHLGLHLQKDLPETVRLLRALHPDVRFALGKPFAHHPKLVDIVLDRIEDCRKGIAEGKGDGRPEDDNHEEETQPPKPGQALRTGYTTGACATAAAKAAAEMLLSQKRVIRTEIALPAGQRATLPIGRCEIKPNWVRCSVVKDAGDDPDATDGAEICVSVEWSESPGVAIEGGEGVGVVTKPGLELPVGSAAINPVPRRMIETAVTETLGEALSGRGVRVIVSVPAGKAYARKTLNWRLGIVGGISILGTTGIVVPFSTSAYTASISQALGVARAAGCREVVLTTGRRTERFAQALLSLREEAFIQAGDFMDFALEECARRGVERATLGLMIGKLSKLAAGQLQTHVSNSMVEQSFLARVASQGGADTATVEAVSRVNTARHFAEIIQGSGLSQVFDLLCQRAAENCQAHVHGRLAVECLLVDFGGAVLGRSGVDR